MKAFAIRHKPSGLFLPMRFRKSRGFTHDEPSAGIPRLFPKRVAAAAALRCWLKGEWEESFTQGEYGEYEPSGPEPKIPKPDRKPEEMEVVQLTISLSARGK